MNILKSPAVPIIAVALTVAGCEAAKPNQVPQPKDTMTQPALTTRGGQVAQLQRLIGKGIDLHDPVSQEGLTASAAPNSVSLTETVNGETYYKMTFTRQGVGATALWGVKIQGDENGVLITEENIVGDNLTTVFDPNTTPYTPGLPLDFAKTTQQLDTAFAEAAHEAHDTIIRGLS